MASAPRRRPRNAWLDVDTALGPELAAAAETAQRIASPRTPAPNTAHAETGSGVGERLADAGFTDRGDPPPPKPMVSTAAGYTIGEPPTGNILRRPQHTEGWSQEVWAYYDAEGELHYVAGQYARAVSRGRLYVATLNDDGNPIEATDGEAARVNRDLLGGPAKASDVLYISALQQFMTGQSLITVSDDDGWEAYSDQDFEVARANMRYANTRRARSLYKVDTGTGTKTPLADGTLTIHLWDRHPGRAYTVDSSVRPALPFLRELARLDQYVQSILLSRIALSGILQLPPGTEVMVPPELRQAIGDTPSADGAGLMATLAAIGIQNISDPGSAAAVLPVLLQMGRPDDKLEHLSIDQPLTGEINSFRELNLKRLAMSLDLAPEALSGFSNVKYSNAEWILSEQVQTHIMRRLNAFASALTTYYVQPALDDERYFVAVDASDLEADQDRTDSAMALYDRGEIDGAALRKYAQMADAQPPEGGELLRQLAVRAVTLNPSLLPALAPLLGLRDVITLTPAQEQALRDAGDGEDGADLDPAGVETRPPRQLDDPAPTSSPVRDPQRLPTTSPATAADAPPRGALDALVAACDVVVCSALASAGARWRRRVRARATLCRGTEPHTIYLAHPLCADRQPGQTDREYAAQLVDGRWAQVPRIAAMHAADPTCLQHTLSTYVADLIADRRPHHPDGLATAVADCVADCVADPVPDRVPAGVT